ncbi:MAG: F0F1 ATP synthase subunit alpha, partial [Candidatus Aenigmarchaeota archaeon]|nr:F0F1 ATP synthase subunit alpha [Candidatus Aenigmarchaeota archaeon]
EIAGFKDDPKFKSIGTVVECADGIARVSGLSGALSQELLEIETKNDKSIIPAIAFNLEEEFIGVVILGSVSSIGVGDKVKGTGKVLSLPVGDALLGRVISPLGEPIDGRGAIVSDANYTLERSAPNVVSRESVKEPLHTGI